jgi:hypothetical protein
MWASSFFFGTETGKRGEGGNQGEGQPEGQREVGTDLLNGNPIDPNCKGNHSEGVED